jgi:hypothetical protein
VPNQRKSDEALGNLAVISPVFSRDCIMLHCFGNRRAITCDSRDAEAGDDHLLGKADLAPTRMNGRRDADQTWT